MMSDHEATQDGGGFDRLKERLRVLLSGEYDDLARYARHVEVLSYRLAEEEPPPGDDHRAATAVLTRLKRAMLAEERALERLTDLAGGSGEAAPTGAAAGPVTASSGTAPPGTGAPAVVSGPRGGVPDEAVDRAVRLRDRVGSLAERPQGVDDLPRVLGWLDRELLGLLDDLGVTVVADEGRVDPARHEVVDTRVAGAGESADHIAATVQVGYCTDDHLVRPQKVIAFVAGEPQW